MSESKAIFIIVWVVPFFPCYWMARKAGFGWPMAIMLSIPLIHYISLYFFAFRKWPALPNA